MKFDAKQLPFSDPSESSAMLSFVETGIASDLTENERGIFESVLESWLRVAEIKGFFPERFRLSKYSDKWIADSDSQPAAEVIERAIDALIAYSIRKKDSRFINAVFKIVETSQLDQQACRTKIKKCRDALVILVDG